MLPAHAETASAHRQGRLLARPSGQDPAASLGTGRHRLGLSGQRDGVLVVPNGLTPTRKVPLIVALHGAGGEAHQMPDLIAGAAETSGVVLLSPESRGPTWDVIRGGIGPDVAFIDEALRETFGQVAVDPARIAIAGFSDGASYALSLGLANGGLFSDILAFSPGFMAAPAQEGRPRIFISHGRSDEVLPIERCSRRLAPALERAGYDLEYLEFEGGHVVPATMVERALARFLA
jgi:phospholipase/carboxylesterase